jgi:hypothetical protein
VNDGDPMFVCRHGWWMRETWRVHLFQGGN